MSTRLSLSYDAATEYYNTDVPFRVYLLKLLIENGATNIESFVKSSIYYTTDADIPLAYWSSIFEGHMDSNFFYTISIIANEQDGSYAETHFSKKMFIRNFKIDLAKAKKLKSLHKR